MRHGALICLLLDNPRSRILDLQKAPGNILAFPSLSEIETLNSCTGFGKCSVYPLSHPFYPVSEIRRTGLISVGTWGLVFVSSTFCSILRRRRLHMDPCELPPCVAVFSPAFWLVSVPLFAPAISC